ncbi:MAG: phosphate ABC transporter permease PstA [Longimicrobiales bacterium]
MSGARGAPSAGAGAGAGVSQDFDPRVRRRHRWGLVFASLCLLATMVGIIALAVLLVDIVRDGGRRLSLDFLTSYASRLPDRAGIKPALLGSLWVLGFTALFSFPVGVATAIWLEEYAPASRLKQVIQTNIANLAGVPSIVYGILGLAVFVRWFAFGRSVLAGALTLTLLILPVIIIAAQEAIRAVPNSIRLGAYALGATKSQTIFREVVPIAMPGILTGTILALSRAVGETAPLIMVGAAGFVSFTPSGPLDRFTVLPLQIFDWVSRPQPEFHALAAAGIIVLLVALLSLNAVAIVLRNRYEKRKG